MRDTLTIKMSEGSSIEAEVEADQSKLVRTGMKEKAAKQVESIINSNEISSTLINFVQSFSDELAEKKDMEYNKLTLSFGVGVGGKAGIKIVDINASSFLKVSVEFERD